MSEHKLNPKPGELWFSPFTYTMFTIHSITDDGWVRYRVSYDTEQSATGPIHTQPAMDFLKKYKRFEIKA